MATANRVVREIPVLFRPNMQVITNKEVVCGYARVSTENEEQEDSFEKQCEHFTNVINSRTDWEFGGVYADWGISGTNAESRKDFMRMIEDCRQGKINRILVKSISRFARNTVDTLQYIRELKELGISVYFETQNIDTMTPGGEVLITILAAMAEQESRNMSTNIKWAYQKRFKDGNVIINYRGTLGYHKEKGETEYHIVEDEAEIIRRVFREYLCGSTIRQIAEGLTADGIKTGRGFSKWSDSAVQGILNNEKYTGNAILGKSFKPDVLSKSRLKNNGQAPRYYVENSHPAIITQEMFDLAQTEKERRRKLRSTTETGDGRYTSLYSLSGLLVCGDCGSKFRRYGRKIADGRKVATWVCITHQKHSNECTMLPLKETDIYAAYKRVMGRLSGDVSEVLTTIKDNITEEFNIEHDENLDTCTEQIVSYQKRVLELFKKKREGAILPEEYDRDYKECSDKIIELQAVENSIRGQNMTKQLKRQRLMQIIDVLSDKTMGYDNENVMKMLIENIKVIGKHEIEFQFKCGITAKEQI